MKRYKSALVLGLGASGAAAVRLLRREGAAVTVLDSAAGAAQLKLAREARRWGARVILGRRTIPPGNFDVCVASPGVPADSSWIKKIEAAGVEVISELDLGASRCSCPVLAITGSKGKSTLTKLCAEAIAIAGKRALAAGNYGLPLCEAAPRTKRLEWIVVEVSSFQLEKTRSFAPSVGVLLNIQPDHLDRHGDMRAYAGLKARIFSRMTARDVGVALDTERDRIARIAGGKNKWATFGLSRGADYRYEAGSVVFREGGHKRKIRLAGTIFDNKVLGLAAAAATAAIRSCGLPAGAVEKAIKAFEPLPHRMSEVARVRGVRFVNDSKATSLTAMAAGIEMCGAPVRLIAGGLLKERNLDIVKKVLERRAVGVYLIGRSSRIMRKAWRDVAPCRLCGNLGKATAAAFADGSPGETVLLSPGCASFDQFKNFEDRGRQFTRIARSIQRGES